MRTIYFPLAAVAVTTLLFVLMLSILHRDDYSLLQESNAVAADFLMPERKIETIHRVEKPKKPEFKHQPELQLPEFNLNNSELSNEMPVFKFPRLNVDLEINLNLAQASGNGDYMPLLKVAPLYPQRAAQRNLEGYVIVEYSVTRSGTVRDVKVVEAKPANVFNKAAKAAARKFKYRPRKIDGELVEVIGVRNKFTFKLEQ